MLALVLWGCPGPATSPSPPALPTPQSVRVDASPLPVCADPTARSVSPFRSSMLSNPVLEEHIYLAGAGVVAADFDGDGISEVLTVRSGSVEYVAFDGDRWTPRDGMPQLALEDAFGAAAADTDADGDLDVILTRWGHENHLLVNDGSGTFTRDPQLAGPADHYSAAPSLADIDLDGDLDLFIAGHGYVDEDGADPTQFDPADDSLVYLGDGQGQFTLATDVLPESVMGGYTFIGAFEDLDGDLDPDLILVNDFGRRYRAGQLLWNTGGQFVPDDNVSGLDLPVAGMGIAIGEVNGDDVPDVLVPYWGGYSLMLSAGDQWFDWSNAAGLTPALPQNQVIGWGANFGDLDNDSTLDAVVMHGWLDTAITDSDPSQPDALFEGVNGDFRNRSEAWAGSDTSDSRGLVVADFDGDGWLDYARPDLSGPTRIQMGVCDGRKGLLVSLNQPAPNPFAVGARIRVSSPDKTLWRRIAAGGEGYGSGGPPEAHFGVANAATVDVEVTWPDGRIDVLTDVQTHQRLRITKLARASQ